MYIVQRGYFNNTDLPLQSEELAVLSELIKAGENGRDYGQCSDVTTGLSLSFLHVRGCAEVVPHPTKFNIMRATPKGLRLYHAQSKGTDR